MSEQQQQQRRGLTLEEQQPVYEDLTKQPKTLTKTRHIDGVLYVAGRSPKEREEYDVMFITNAVEEDEATSHAVSTFGFRVPQPAEYLKGPNGLIKDVALRAGVDMEECYYTAVCKWLLPRSQRSRPPKKVMRWGLPVLEDEIRRVKPKIIVCLGKPVFDLVSDKKIKFADAHGCWFWSEEYQAHLYVMHAPYTLVGNPEHYETFRIDFKEVARRKQLLDLGVEIIGAGVNYQVIDNKQDLQDWLSHIEDLATGDDWPGYRTEDGHPILSVDCEWHGKTHVDGDLRTIQIAWSETDAAVIEFRNEENEFSFNLGESDVRKGAPRALYRQVGSWISPVFDRMNARYIGHHFAADAPWMEHWLGIETYERCELDTEFAQQTVDESSELGLERGIAMKYTNLGRYDQDLVEFKRHNRALVKGGYGYIPRKILHPYACLRQESKVQLGDGSWEEIGRLVNEKYSGTVKALVNGEVKNCKVEGWHRNDVEQKEWFRLRAASTKSNRYGVTGGPVFTPDHEVVTQTRGKVRVDQLRIGKDKIITDELEFTEDQLSIVLGSLLGDGGITQRNDAGCGFAFSQYGDRVPYAEWKAATLASVLSFSEVDRPSDGNHRAGKAFASKHNKQMLTVMRDYPRCDPGVNANRKLMLSPEVMSALGYVGFAVWYQDDGVFTRDKTCRIICAKLTEAEVRVAEGSCQYLFGDVNYDFNQGALMFSREASKTFLEKVAPFIHPALQYKSDVPVGSKLDDIDSNPKKLFAETVMGVIPAPSSRKGSGNRYCLSVPEAGNFLTKAGFVSNCKDVCAPYRAYPIIKRQLEAQRLWEYYRDIFNPFVTDVFVEFTKTGLPMDVPMMDDLRNLFTWAKDRLNKKLQERIAREAVEKFKSMVAWEFGMMPLTRINSHIEKRDEESLKRELKELLSEAGRMKEVNDWNKKILHLVNSPSFNLRSPDQMANWLFDFEGLTPIKSTNQKAKGLPSMSWEKVMELPPDRQALYKPAVDMQTLTILSEELPIIDELLNLNAVGNLSKAFLNEPSLVVNPDTGEEEWEEHGLHSWLCSDGRIHGQMSTTETGRPRSWAPNTLNYPSNVNKRIARTIERAIKEAHEEGDLPEDLLRWVGISGADLPSIRSCIKAPDGMVLVESDYATAEMVALAKISGDPDLTRILEEPDPEWAQLKPGHSSGASEVRVRFEDAKVTGVPESARNEEFIMCVWKSGEKVAEVTEEDLMRGDEGNVVHAKYDIHWSLAERTYGKYREMMSKKVERDAAKVINFCLDADSQVPTRDRGAVSISDIRLDDLLWDGVEWVNHDGVIATGRKEIVEYQGLRATRLHDVWTVERGKVKLEEACVESLTLLRSEAPSVGDDAEIRQPATVPGQRGAAREGLLLREDAVRVVRDREVQGAQKPGEGLLVEVSVPGEEQIEGSISRSGSGGHLFADASLCRDEAEMLHGHSCVVAPLPESGDRSGVQGQGRFHRVGLGELHGRPDSVERLRQNRQRRELLPREPATGRSVDQPYEPGPGTTAELSGGQAVPQGSPGSSLHVENSVGAHENGARGRRDLDEACAKFSCGEAETYDILNAGPRHRFTCSGVIVSNSSAYGASSNSLERKIESDTGVKPEEGTGERGLEAIAERQPRATQFLEEMARVPKEKGFYRAISGRIRHCPMHGAGSGVGWRTRNAIESSLGRQMRNFPFQESVGATSARACKWLLHAYLRLGLKARPMTCLYDSVVTLCPLEERFLVARLHDICMSEVNRWHYDDEEGGGPRVLQYSIDNEYNWRWSTEPTDEEKDTLADPEFHPPTPAHDMLAKHPELTSFIGLQHLTD